MDNSISIIISNNLRSLEYLNVFIKLKKEPNKVIYIDDNKNKLTRKKIIKILYIKKNFKNKKKF